MTYSEEEIIQYTNILRNLNDESSNILHSKAKRIFAIRVVEYLLLSSRCQKKLFIIVISVVLQ